MSENPQAPEECAVVREVIERNIFWINNTSLFFEEDEDGYENQQYNLNLALSALRQAFQSRPQTCVMTEVGEDRYNCDKCMFEAEIT